MALHALALHALPPPSRRRRVSLCFLPDPNRCERGFVGNTIGQV